MTQKRRISFEQDKALEAGRRVARANQRRQAAARQAREADERERAERAAAEAAKPKECPTCGRWRRHDEFCTELTGSPVNPGHPDLEP
jgi:membrane protease subunit (stomatin/prohibitin family)